MIVQGAGTGGQGTLGGKSWDTKALGHARKSQQMIIERLLCARAFARSGIENAIRFQSDVVPVSCRELPWEAGGQPSPACGPWKPFGLALSLRLTPLKSSVHRRREGHRKCTSWTHLHDQHPDQETECQQPPHPRPPGLLPGTAHPPGNQTGVSLCSALCTPVGHVLGLAASLTVFEICLWL